MVGHQHVGMYGAAMPLRGLVQQRQVGELVIWLNETGLAIVPALDDALRDAREIGTRGDEAWPILIGSYLQCVGNVFSKASAGSVATGQAIRSTSIRKRCLTPFLPKEQARRSGPFRMCRLGALNSLYQSSYDCTRPTASSAAFTSARSSIRLFVALIKRVAGLRFGFQALLRVQQCCVAKARVLEAANEQGGRVIEPARA